MNDDDTTLATEFFESAAILETSFQRRDRLAELLAKVRADERKRVARALYEQKEVGGSIYGAKSAAVFVRGLK